MLKVVFDTSVYISAFGVPGSRSEQAYLLALRGKIELYTSPEILTETANVLSMKFKFETEVIEKLIENIGKTSSVVKPKTKINILFDEPDNRILECAVFVGAHMIVSGDKHLLNLKTYEDIAIVRVADLLHTVP